ncbi:MAG: hypothetical protein HY565_04295 [Candidatus Kerfeldbacteria bacterium]|nr:hypothetical protein [Candidatus Kerfeldbacteria bacterium]
MKKYLFVLPLLVIGLAASLPASAKTYTKIELLTVVLNNIYDGKGKYTEQTCGDSTDKPAIEVAFDDIDTEGTVVSATIDDEDIIYASAGTIKKKAGNSFYTLKLTGSYSDANADYAITLKGRITKTKPTIIRKVKVAAVANLSEELSEALGVDHCDVSVTFKKLMAQ